MSHDCAPEMKCCVDSSGNGCCRPFNYPCPNSNNPFEAYSKPDSNKKGGAETWTEEITDEAEISENSVEDEAN